MNIQAESDSPTAPTQDGSVNGERSPEQAASPLEESAAVNAQTSQISPLIFGKPSPRREVRAVRSCFHNAPYRPDTAMDGWTNECFQVLAASSRGHSHRVNGAPRQDDFALMQRKGGSQVVVAIADGVSQASQSHLGATVAVRYVLQWLGQSVGEQTEATDWQAMLRDVAWTLTEQARQIFSVDSMSECESLLATTLAVAVLDRIDSGARAHIVSHGDSSIWRYRQGNFSVIDAGKGEIDGGLFSSSVQCLPRVPEKVQVQMVDLEYDDVLLIGTDGVGDPLGSGQGRIGEMLGEVLERRPPSMLEFACAIDFEKETFVDDRTLVALWPIRPA